MHIQIINFHLKGITEGEYSKLCDQLAPALASIPGLASKVWLADSSTNTSGGVYIWEDGAAAKECVAVSLAKYVQQRQKEGGKDHEHS